MTRYDLKGRIAGVTGATGALGTAVVRALAEDGAPTTRGWSCAPPT